MKGKMFKYIFSLLLLFVVLSGNSQTINGRLYTQFNNYYKWRGGAFDSVLLLPNLTGTAGLRGGALRYNGADSSLYVYTGTQWRKIDGSGSGSNPTLQQVTTQGNTTTTDIVKTDGFGRELVVIRGPVSEGQVRVMNPLESGGGSQYTTYGRHGIGYMGNLNTGGVIQYPDTTGIGQRFVIGAKLNGTVSFPSTGGFIDLGTISLSGSGTLDFPSTDHHHSSDLTINVTGASVGDVVAIGVPIEALSANGIYVGWVSATDTVTIRFTNTHNSNNENPNSGLFKIKVFK